MTDAESFLTPYRSVDPDGAVRVSAEQASHFAKDVAGDFNPLHDVGARRFCVPGDLLCGLVLARYGLSGQMSFGFRDMVGAGEALHFPDTDEERFAVRDARGGVYLDVERDGPVTTEARQIERFVREYVAFSGKTFPHYMIPALEAQGVMFHPQRPLVVYDSMGFDLAALDFERPEMELADIELRTGGRRGDTLLRFEIRDGDERIGAGWKKLVISGLRPFDADQMRGFLQAFHERKAAHEAARGAAGGDGH